MSDDKSQGKTLPEYEKPPVTEVAFGVVFEQIQQFKAPHTGLLWEKFRAEYPTCEHAPPIGLGPEAFQMAGGLPLPRIWFISEEGNNLIQVQNDRFHFNWRQMSDEDTYPGYNVLISPFKESLKVFAEFIEEVGLGPLKLLECELLYINQILKGQSWSSPADIHKVFPDLTWRSDAKRFLPTPSDIAWNTSFALPEERGRLNVTLQPASRKADKVPLMQLQLTARGLGDDKSPEAVWNWFELAHEWIVCGFTDLTSTGVQKKLWGRRH